MLVFLNAQNGASSCNQLDCRHCAHMQMPLFCIIFLLHLNFVFWIFSAVSTCFCQHAKCQSICELTAAAAHGKPFRQAAKPHCVCLYVQQCKWHEMWHSKFYLLDFSNYAYVCANESRHARRNANI